MKCTNGSTFLEMLKTNRLALHYILWDLRVYKDGQIQHAGALLVCLYVSPSKVQSSQQLQALYVRDLTAVLEVWLSKKQQWVLPV